MQTEIGSITFVVPQVVLNELEKLQHIQSKRDDILQTMQFANKLKKIPLSGTYADKEIINYIKEKRCIIGTLDKELKKQIKQLGSSVLSLSNNKIILES